MWESASAHMDGRQRDRRDVVLFCADLCLSAGFEDAHHSSDASPLLLCNAGMSLDGRFFIWLVCEWVWASSKGRDRGREWFTAARSHIALSLAADFELQGGGCRVRSKIATMLKENKKISGLYVCMHSVCVFASQFNTMTSIASKRMQLLSRYFPVKFKLIGGKW